MRDTPSLTIVEPPDVGACMAELSEARQQYALQADLAVIGFIVTRFTNDEIRAIADEGLTIGETLTLRDIGLLGPDEGFDGSKKPRRPNRRAGAGEPG